MNVELVVVPYDSGVRGARMGAGPDALLAGGLIDHLRGVGHQVEVGRVESRLEFPGEVAVGFDLAAQISERVRTAAAEGRFPLVLAGNCNTALGTIAGLGCGDTAVGWFDAHGDFNTPDTTTSGFLDGMALAVATGRCWMRMAAQIPGFRAVPDEHIVMIGARDLDAGEARLLDGTAVARVSASDVRERGAAAALGDWLAPVRERCRGAYVHVDLDALDADEATPNSYTAPDGVSADELLECVRAVAVGLPVRGAAITAFDPACDPDGRALRFALRVARVLVEAGG